MTIHLNRDQLEFIFKNVEVMPNGCWNYQRIVNPGYYGFGSTSGERTIQRGGRRGYGYIFSAHRDLKGQAHRVMYAWAIGPLRRGLVIDHLCENKACCNPAHLEQVTHLENVRRSNKIGHVPKSKIGRRYKRVPVED